MFRGLRDEACQHVLCGILVLDALRQTDTALLHAEDKGTLSLRLAKGTSRRRYFTNTRIAHIKLIASSGGEDQDPVYGYTPSKAKNP